MKLNDVICGFLVESAYESKELGGTLWGLRHEATGAPLYWLDNGAENKVFSVSFKTVPWDDTGVFHILEHSVLCGSKKYPVKEPFLDLIKSSMNTFLNAMTFQDKTMYPVGSRNEKDFLNLVSVYLDAVFQPAITENRSIFLQEGTRIDFDGEAPEFNGVVYNEMKGACASLNSKLVHETERLLFPESPYGYNSGGDPAAIPSLTYEAFLEAYRTFYHPSNCVFYLDGSVPVEKVLPMIAQYLSAYQKSDTVHRIGLQPPVGNVKVTAPYEIGEDESPEKKTCIAVGKTAGVDTDRTRMFALDIIRSYLFGSNDAPIKRAVLETGLAEDVSFSVYNGIYQPFTMLILRNTEEAHKDTLLAAVKEAARQTLEAGVDPAELAAEIDSLELNLKEPDEPQGVERAIDLADAVFFGAAPETYLEYDAMLADLRGKVDTPYFTDLIKEFFIDGENLAEVTLVPDATLGKQAAEAEQQRLDAKLASMDAAALSLEKARFEAFQTWQDTPDSDEQKATLPTLSVSDVPAVPTPFVTEEKCENGRPADFHPVHTSGISYVRLYFDCGDLPFDSLPALSFIRELLGQLPTKKHTVRELEHASKRCTGWIDYGVFTALTADAPAVRCRLNVGFSALPRKLPEAIALVSEIFTETLFTEKAKVKDILTQRRDRLYRSICAAGSRFAGTRALAASNAEAAADDLAEGLGYYRWLKAFEKDFDARFDAFAAEAAALLARICVSARLSVSETADSFHSDVFGAYAAFPQGEASPTEAIAAVFPEEKRREAYLVPGSVSFAALGTDFRTLGYTYRGEMRVLSNLLTFGYLWDEIRVRGGAYGCGCVISEAETLRFYSYRDPSPVRSLDVYNSAADWLREFCDSDVNVNNYVISAVAAADPLRSPSSQGFAADSLKIQGKTEADRIRLHREALAADKESLLALAPLLRAAAEQGSVCVIGCREALADMPAPWTVEEL